MKRFHRRRGHGERHNREKFLQGRLTAEEVLSAYERNPRALSGTLVKTSIGLVIVVKEGM